ncbi:hypothetical protein F5Y15DRAFT_416692 [Xylariaceae sp. FL0016]|nr:hypothetical protein F5Y15DRAFT_416692 [Xylariaceae sp. FL0016]
MSSPALNPSGKPGGSSFPQNNSNGQNVPNSPTGDPSQVGSNSPDDGSETDSNNPGGTNGFGSPGSNNADGSGSNSQNGSSDTGTSGDPITGSNTGSQNGQNGQSNPNSLKPLPTQNIGNGNQGNPGSQTNDGTTTGNNGSEGNPNSPSDTGSSSPGVSGSNSDGSGPKSLPGSGSTDGDGSNGLSGSPGSNNGAQGNDRSSGPSYAPEDGNGTGDVNVNTNTDPSKTCNPIVNPPSKSTGSLLQGTVAYSMPSCLSCPCPTCTLVSTFTTTYPIFDSSGEALQPYTISETYVGMPALPFYGDPTAIPFGFITSLMTCAVPSCGPQPITATMTFPRGGLPFLTASATGTMMSGSVSERPTDLPPALATITITEALLVTVIAWNNTCSLLSSHTSARKASMISGPISRSSRSVPHTTWSHPTSTASTNTHSNETVTTGTGDILKVPVGILACLVAAGIVLNWI